MHHALEGMKSGSRTMHRVPGDEKIIIPEGDSLLLVLGPWAL